jgi:hypothetical protein
MAEQIKPTLKGLPGHPPRPMGTRGRAAGRDQHAGPAAGARGDGSTGVVGLRRVRCLRVAVRAQPHPSLAGGHAGQCRRAAHRLRGRRRARRKPRVASVGRGRGGRRGRGAGLFDRCGPGLASAGTAVPRLCVRRRRVGSARPLRRPGRSGHRQRQRAVRGTRRQRGRPPPPAAQPAGQTCASAAGGRGALRPRRPARRRRRDRGGHRPSVLGDGRGRRPAVGTGPQPSSCGPVIGSSAPCSVC